MYTLYWSQLFFCISSIGFVLLWILSGVFLYYAIRSVRTFSRILCHLEKDISHIEDTTTGIYNDMKENAIFKFFFAKRTH